MAKYMSSGVIRLWSLNRIPAYVGSNEVESPNAGVAITYIHCCKIVLMFYNADRIKRALVERGFVGHG
jgi:hypothetical protein